MPSVNKKKEQVSRFTCVVRGHGFFKGWSSHHVRVLFEIVECADGNGPSARKRMAFGQKSRTGGDAYVQPNVSKKEMKRMKEVALKRFHNKLAAAQSGIAPDDEAPMTVPATASEVNEAKMHQADLCQYCNTHPVPCTGTMHVLDDTFVTVANRKRWKQRERRVRTAKRAVEELLREAGANLWDRIKAIAGVRVLYHQTGDDAARSILESNCMRRGERGMFGGGIYFADSPEATESKAHDHGAILKCAVYVGKQLVVHARKNFTFSSVTNEGYDSVHAQRAPGFLPSGDEYIVYNKDQVLKIVRA